jgi:uncharacterized protein YejL (UPF0352 family)
VAYDEGLAERVRDVLADRAGVAERKLFGGLAFMVRGNMACGVMNDDLVVASRQRKRRPRSRIRTSGRWTSPAGR